MTIQRCLLTIAFLLTATLTTGCSTTTYQPSRMANFQLDANYEINDEDITKAFEAKPQMGEQVNVAFFSFDTTKVDEIKAMLEKTPKVAQAYNLPEFMITGRGRYDTPNRYETPKPPSIKKMRLMAARAHCDVLLIFDYGYKVEHSANGLTALNVLLVPVFFTPFLDQKVQSHFDAYIIDVRNGYLYGHISSTEEGEEDYVTIWGEIDPPMVKSQWDRLLTQTQGGLEALIKSEAGKAPVAKPEPTVPAKPSKVDIIP